MYFMRTREANRRRQLTRAYFFSNTRESAGRLQSARKFVAVFREGKGKKEKKADRVAIREGIFSARYPGLFS